MDFGHDFNGVNSMMVGNDELDLFVFLGTPREILDEYTKLTGKSPMPPLWSFGLWMSRCTYNAEQQMRDIAAKLRALFVEFPGDPGSWQIDDEYLYGSSMLVAPLMHAGENTRQVYLPPGTWIDYQTSKAYAGGWQTIEAGNIPAVILVRDGAVLPRIALAQSTAQMDWSKIELVVYAKDATMAKGLIFLPGESASHEITLTKSGDTFKLDTDPLAGKVKWNITEFSHQSLN